LIHLIDVSAIDVNDPLKAYSAICAELAAYNKKLTQKPQIVVLNKLDLPGADKTATKFKSAAKGMDILSISAITGKGIDVLKSKIVAVLDAFHESEQKKLL
jgi:GTP-binding protein